MEAKEEVKTKRKAVQQRGIKGLDIKVDSGRQKIGTIILMEEELKVREGM